jgi:hypothetical protein
MSIFWHHPSVKRPQMDESSNVLFWSFDKTPLGNQQLSKDAKNVSFSDTKVEKMSIFWHHPRGKMDAGSDLF